MKLIEFLCKKIRSVAPTAEKPDGQDLALYRQLRTAENKLFERRSCMDRLQMLRSDDSQQQDCARKPGELQEEIDGPRSYTWNKSYRCEISSF